MWDSSCDPAVLRIDYIVFRMDHLGDHNLDKMGHGLAVRINTIRLFWSQ